MAVYVCYSADLCVNMVEQTYRYDLHIIYFSIYIFNTFLRCHFRNSTNQRRYNWFFLLSYWHVIHLSVAMLICPGAQHADARHKKAAAEVNMPCLSSPVCAHQPAATFENSFKFVGASQVHVRYLWQELLVEATRLQTHRQQTCKFVIMNCFY